MPVIKVTDMAFGRLRAPDLDTMEEFLTRFGMVRAERTPTALYMRGTDPVHHIHVTEKGEPKFVGFAYYAGSEDDLRRVAASPGASGIEHIDEPGGGRRVRLTEPNGYQIEIVHDIAAVASIAAKRQKLNTGEDPLLRAGELMRLPKGPSHVKRIGHGVLMTPKFHATVRWFREQFGKYEHMWGLGRHVLGSQVYDYWADPWGRVHEHWADSDRLNLANGSNLVPAEEALTSQWGEAPPQKFINHASI
jgi:catechol 2,3-dioxygenase-like lactoylglutathione lyase family enzyme